MSVNIAFESATSALLINGIGSVDAAAGRQRGRRCSMVGLGTTATAIFALAVAVPATAAVYTPSFNGPDLDASIMVNEPAGFTHTVGFGTLTLSKLQGAGSDTPNILSYASYISNFVAFGDYDATVTLDRSQLGQTSFQFFGGNLDSEWSIAVTGDAVRSAYRDDPAYIYIVNNDPRPSGLLTFEAQRTNGMLRLLVNNSQILSVAEQAFPVGFGFGTINSDPAQHGYTTAFVTNYSVTTPDACVPGPAPCVAPGVPEPATWALLITGFGAVGAAARRRRVAFA